MQGTRFLKQAVANQPQRTATITPTPGGTRRRSWAEVSARVPRLAAALRALGIEGGAFVAALAMNSDRYVELFFAVPWAGGAFAPLNIRWSVAENDYALTDSKASVLFVDEHFIDQARELKAKLAWVKTLVYMGEGATPQGMLGYEDLVARHEPMVDANRRGEDLWVIFYTGGTTAHPKGVMMSHRGLFVATVTYLGASRAWGWVRAGMLCHASLDVGEACGGPTQRVDNDEWNGKASQPFGLGLQRGSSVVAKPRCATRRSCVLRLG